MTRLVMLMTTVVCSNPYKMCLFFFKVKLLSIPGTLTLLVVPMIVGTVKYNQAILLYEAYEERRRLVQIL